MSEPLRIAAAVEGPTDRIVLQAIVEALLPNQDFVLQVVQPEVSAAFEESQFGQLGGGWPGVYKWCRQSATEGAGSVLNSTVLRNYDLVIVHVDADVAGKTYKSGNIPRPVINDLPCDEPCPPASATADRLRAVVSDWLGLTERGPIVLCIPSKNMDAWMVAALLPDFVTTSRTPWECVQSPMGRVGGLPRRIRFGKSQHEYEARKGQLTGAWPKVSSQLGEASRFERELRPFLASS